MDGIIDTAIHTFVLDGRQALAIWAGLTALAVVAFVALSATGRREWLGVARSGPTWARRRRAALETTYADLRRSASEIAIAARRAAATAQRRHDDWLVARGIADAARQAFDDADALARKLILAAGCRIPAEHLSPSDVAERERYLHRAAAEAFNQGDLSIDQLLDALSDRNGWSPCRHPADQEVLLRRLARQRRLWLYQTAAAAERNAWYNADLAIAARRSLDDEAFAAQVQARLAFSRLARAVPQHRRQPTPLSRRLWALGRRPGMAPSAASQTSGGSASVAVGTASVRGANATGRATVRLA
ncbi:MAG: hypothetical protein JXA67_04520 [Micromonosporaceae bacterium]|nr:hypothetical protein [Micromonosporaceae bacterium]